MAISLDEIEKIETHLKIKLKHRILYFFFIFFILQIFSHFHSFLACMTQHFEKGRGAARRG